MSTTTSSPTERPGKIFNTDDKIEYLVNRRYPPAEVIKEIMAITGVGTSPDAEILPNPESEKYRKKLQQMSVPEVFGLYLSAKQEEERLAEETRERLMFYNQSSAGADLVHWSKMPFWSLEEAEALKFGKEPKIVNWDTMLDCDDNDELEFPVRYKKFHEIVIRSHKAGELQAKTRPIDFLNWTKKIDEGFPEELEDLILKRNGKPTKKQKMLTDREEIEAWKKHFSKLKSVLDKTEARLKERDTEIAALNVKIQELENKSAPETLPTKERNTLLKLVLGLSLACYSFRPETGKLPISSIASDLLTNGLTMSEDTVRKYLSEAIEKYYDPIDK